MSSTVPTGYASSAAAEEDVDTAEKERRNADTSMEGREIANAGEQRAEIGKNTSAA